MEHTVVGNVLSFVLEDKRFLSKKKRTVRVYLPKSYSESSKPFKVIYMFDGNNLFDEYTASYHKEWKIDETLTELEEQGCEPSVVIGIDCSRNRISEYLPHFSSKEVDEYSYLGDITLDFLVNKVIPYVEKNFNVRTDREGKSIGGSSMGGLMALASICFYPKEFSNCYAFSIAFPMFKYGDSEKDDEYQNGIGNDEAFNFVINRLKEPNYLNKYRFAVVSGGTGMEETFYPYVKRFKNRMVKNGWDEDRIFTAQNKKYVHDEHQWAIYFKDAYIYFNKK